MWAVDVNARALELTAANAARNGVTTISAVAPDDVPEDVRFAHDLVEPADPDRQTGAATSCCCAGWRG